MFQSTPRQQSLDKLVGTHQVAVYRYLRLLGAARDAAEDLLQETFLVVLRSDFEERDEIATRVFLRRTARNLFLHSMRTERQRHAAWADLVDEHLEAHTSAENPWLDALDECLASLQGRAREALKMVYNNHQDRAEVAAALGLKENGLKTLLQRSKDLLRTCVTRRIT